MDQLWKNNRESKVDNTSEDALNVYWWAGRKNFGDLIGPYLISRILARPVTNIYGTEKCGIFSVGSIIAHIKQPGTVVWGSGLIKRPTAKQINTLKNSIPKEVLAVRGYKTYSTLRKKAGWNVPKNLGDPALILPSYYEPNTLSGTARKIGFVPHYKHKPFARWTDKKLNIVGVERDVEDVVDDIASLSCCVSTSLHGIIVAHAYGIPWTWLRIEDSTLVGDQFKFEDFFTVLDRENTSIVNIRTKDISAENILRIARKSKLPKDKFEFKPLADSLLDYAIRHGL